MMFQPKRRITLNWGILIAIVALSALGFTLADVSGSGDRQPIPQPKVPAETAGLEVAPVKGSIAPDFRLQNLDGEEVQLSDFRGHPVLINLWATWCGPCRLEMPAIQDRFELYEQEGLVVLAVDFDEAESTVNDFRDELGLTFQILLDPGANVQKLYRNRNYPSSFFVDEAGVIQVHHIGVMTEDQLDDNLAEIGVGP
jgi:cytochrome c biogenesis protein CcmG/thiol:disulfide interchange protein DsbE